MECVAQGDRTRASTFRIRLLSAETRFSSPSTPWVGLEYSKTLGVALKASRNGGLADIHGTMGMGGCYTPSCAHREPSCRAAIWKAGRLALRGDLR